MTVVEVTHIMARKSRMVQTAKARLVTSRHNYSRKWGQMRLTQQGWNGRERVRCNIEENQQ